MSPYNLEDIEEYLLKWAKGINGVYCGPEIEQGIRNRFAELRLREASVLQSQADMHKDG